MASVEFMTSSWPGNSLFSHEMFDILKLIVFKADPDRKGAYSFSFLSIINPFIEASMSFFDQYHWTCTNASTQEGKTFIPTTKPFQ